MKGQWQVFNGTSIEWNEFIFKNNSEFRQLYEWGETKKYLGWKVVRICLKDSNQILLSAQIHIRKSLFFSSCYIPGGINGNLNYLNKDIFKFIKKQCKTTLVYLRSDFIRSINTDDQLLLSRLNWKKPLYKMHNGSFIKINLEKDLDQIICDAKQKWRYHYKKSLKNNIITKKIDNPTHVYFSQIQNEVSYGRNARNLYSEREMSAQIEYLKDKLLIVSAFDPQNNLLATRSVVILNNKAWHNYSGVNRMGRNLYAGFPLVIELIKQCQERGINSLNLGELNNERWPGPSRFKSGIDREAEVSKVLGEWEWSNFIFISLLNNIFIMAYVNASYFISKFWKNL